MRPPPCLLVLVVALSMPLAPFTAFAGDEEEDGAGYGGDSLAGYLEDSGEEAETADPLEPPTLFPVVLAPDGPMVPGFDTPRGVSTVSEETLTHRWFPDLASALSPASVFVARSHHRGGGASVRGVGGARLAVYVDDVRLHDSTTRTGWDESLATVDPWSVGRIEVIHGPKGVRWGIDASAPAIRLVTHKATPHRTVGVLSPSFHARYDSSDNSGHGRATILVENFGAGILAGLTGRVLGNLRGGGGLESPSAFGEWAFDSRLTVGALNGHEFNLAVQTLGAYGVPLTGRCRHAADACAFDHRRTRTLVYLNYRYLIGSGVVETADVTLSVHHKGELRDRKPTRDATLTTRRIDRVVTPGITARFDTTLVEKLTLQYGAELYMDAIRSREVDFSLVGSGPVTLRGRLPVAAVHGDLGLFARVDWNPVRPLHLWLGGRFGGVAAHSGIDPVVAPRRGFLFAGAGSEAGIAVRADDIFQIAAAFAQGFRFPSWDDFAGLGAEMATFDVPNPDLRPERFLQASITPKLSVGPLDLLAGLSVTHLGRPMIRLPSTWQGSATVDALPVIRLENADHGWLVAGEARALVRFSPTWTAFAGVSWSWGRASHEGIRVRLDRMAPAFGHLGVGWRTRDDRGFAELVVDWAGPRRTLSPAEVRDPFLCSAATSGCTGTAAWATVSVYAGWTPVEGVRTTLAIRNLGNTSVRWRGSGVDSPGASAILGLDVTL